MRLCANAFNHTIKFCIIRIFHLPRGYHVDPRVDLKQKAPQDRAYLCHQLLLLTLFQPTTSNSRTGKLSKMELLVLEYQSSQRYK